MIERYGTKHALQNQKLAQKCEETTIKNHGCARIFQNADFIKENAKRAKIKQIFTHWQTGKEIVAVCGYEIAVVNWLQNNRIPYEWQICFNMPNGYKYYVDLYLPEKDLYVEIKGRWYPDALEKWNWFHSEFSNSEIWNSKTLKQLSIL